MKKIILLFAVLLSLPAIAQNNPGNMPQLLLNKEVKILPLPSYDQKGYEKFYESEKMLFKYKKDKKFSDRTTPSALEGRVFKVTAVEHYKDMGLNRIRFELTDDKDKIYYQYDADFGFYPFEVIGGIEYTDKFYDGYIKPYEDSYGKGFETVNRNYKHIVFKKQKGKADKYTITINVSADLPVDGRKGVVLHFENGKTLNFPKAEVDDWTTPKGYRTIVTLTMADVEFLKANKIVGCMVLDKKKDVDPETAHYLQGVFNRLVTK